VSAASVAIEIATALKAAFTAFLPTADDLLALGVPTDHCAVRIYADGVHDGADAGEPADKPDRIVTPCMLLQVGGRVPIGHRSAFGAYPAAVEIQTEYANDPHQFALYAVAEALDGWVYAPTLTLTRAKLNSITIDGAPRRGLRGQTTQVLAYALQIHCQRTA
jgi:hypothetical protein